MHQYFERGSCLFGEGQKGIPLRLTEGLVMLCADAQYRPIPIYLAKAGDVLGAETLFQSGYEWTAIAMTDVCLTDLQANARRSELLRESFKRQQSRMVEMIQMRTGRLAKRLSLLVRALIASQPGMVGPIARRDLPSLREMSIILDSAPESICRELAHQPLVQAESESTELPPSSSQRRSPNPTQAITAFTPVAWA